MEVSVEGRSDGFTAIEDQYAGYTVYDPDGDKIGKVDDLFLDENDQPEYLGVKMGFLGTKSTLIPWEMVEVREADSSLIISADDGHVKNGPTFDDDREITPEFESEVYSYYGLQQQSSGTSTEDRGTYAEYSSSQTTSGSAGPGMAMGDTESGEFREDQASGEGVSGGGSHLYDRDGLWGERRVEERDGGPREVEAGAMRVGK